MLGVFRGILDCKALNSILCGRILTVDTKVVYERLKDTPEQKSVVGPLVSYLIDSGWHLEQIIYGKKEWFIPKTPSEATRREKGQSFSGFPVDVAVFDDPGHVGDPRHLLFIIECKQPTEEAGIAQLESYYVGEPHCILGIWANDSIPSARATFLYRSLDGRLVLKRQNVADLPQPGEPIRPELQRLCFRDLVTPTEQVLKKLWKTYLTRSLSVTRM